MSEPPKETEGIGNSPSRLGGLVEPRPSKLHELRLGRPLTEQEKEFNRQESEEYEQRKRMIELMKRGAQASVVLTVLTLVLLSFWKNEVWGLVGLTGTPFGITSEMIIAFAILLLGLFSWALLKGLALVLETLQRIAMRTSGMHDQQDYRLDIITKELTRLSKLTKTDET